jgi:hypothetical protein
MEQTAAHGGMPGAYPYSTVSGGRRAVGPPAPPSAGSPAPGGAGAADQPPAAGPPPLPDEGAFGEGEQ